MIKYLKLFIALSVLYFVAVFVIPVINRTYFMRDFQANVRKWDINTSAFFYTDNISSNKEIQEYTDK